MVHRTSRWITSGPLHVGDKLFPVFLWRNGFRTKSASDAIVRLLKLLAVGGAQKFSFKAFRAGKATEMAATGSTLHQILSAGEWRSAAFARYVDEDIADSAQLLRCTIDASSDEEAQ